MSSAEPGGLVFSELASLAIPVREDYQSKPTKVQRTSRGYIMVESTGGPRKSALSLRAISNAPADENVASMVDLLLEQLKLVREGKLRSIAIASVSSDGAAIGTQWSCTHGDLASLIGKLTVLAYDMMAARR